MAPQQPATDTRSAFEALVLPERPGLYAAALHLCGQSDEARDLVQETLMRAWRFWGGYRDDGRCGAWLRRILRNAFINRYRGRRREEAALRAYRDGVLRVTPVAAQAPERDGFGDEVTAALGQLRPEYRKVVLAVDRDQRSYREVAEALSCPVGTVMSRLHRGRRQLRERLADYGESRGYLRAG